MRPRTVLLPTAVSTMLTDKYASVLSAPSAQLPKTSTQKFSSHGYLLALTGTNHLLNFARIMLRGT